ncbi:MAG TPA: DedA family protein [Chloroflexota bacterium]|nr:DedA family protein [Chloroflexota bacterium]
MLGTIEVQLFALFEGLYLTIGYTGVVIAMAIESACVPLPSEIILPMAGWMVYRGDFTILGATLAGTLGSVIGSSIAYWVGYFGGRPLLERYGRYILIRRHDIDVADRWFARYGEISIFFSRLLPVVRTFISLPAGIARMHFGRFIVFTTLGSLPWCLALVYAGKVVGDNRTAVYGTLHQFDYVIAALIVAAVAWYVYRHVSGALVGEETNTRVER